MSACLRLSLPNRAFCSDFFCRATRFFSLQGSLHRRGTAISSYLRRFVLSPRCLAIHSAMHLGVEPGRACLSVKKDGSSAKRMWSVCGYFLRAGAARLLSLRGLL